MSWIRSLSKQARKLWLTVSASCRMDSVGRGPESRLSLIGFTRRHTEGYARLSAAPSRSERSPRGSTTVRTRTRNTLIRISTPPARQQALRQKLRTVRDHTGAGLGIDTSHVADMLRHFYGVSIRSCLQYRAVRPARWQSWMNGWRIALATPVGRRQAPPWKGSFCGAAMSS